MGTFFNVIYTYMFDVGVFFEIAFLIDCVELSDAFTRIIYCMFTCNPPDYIDQIN